jgi:hypothetical protein
LAILAGGQLYKGLALEIVKRSPGRKISQKGSEDVLQDPLANQGSQVFFL